MRYTFYQSTKVLFGEGRLNELGDAIKGMDLGRKAVIVISNGRSVRANGALSRTQEQLAAAGIEAAVFDRVQANPLASTIMEGANFVKAQEADFIVALGGGSVMDAAKIIAIMATNPGDVWDYAYGGHGGCKPYENAPLPVIAITTTAGTGSEVDAWGVVNNEQYDEKIGIGGADASHPVLAIVDPGLMVTVPADFTAYQGFDALFHSTEGYISASRNEFSKMVLQRPSGTWPAIWRLPSGSRRTWSPCPLWPWAAICPAFRWPLAPVPAPILWNTLCLHTMKNCLTEQGLL